MRAARGFSPAAMQKLTFAPGEGITGQAMTTGEPAIIEDAATDPRGAGEYPELKALALAEGIHSFMHLPIRLDSATFGVFNVSYTVPRGSASASSGSSPRSPSVRPSRSRTPATSTRSTGGPSSSA